MCLVIIIVNNNVYGAVIMHCRCESSPGSYDEYSTMPGTGCRLLDQARDHLNIHHRHLLLLSLKAGTHFASPEGRRLSQLGWLVTYRGGLPAHVDNCPSRC